MAVPAEFLLRILKRISAKTERMRDLKQRQRNYQRHVVAYLLQ